MLDFPSSQYIAEETDKSQIVLYHTASGRGVDGDFRSWLSNKERVATNVIIDYQGTINQLFSSRFWGYHLGVKQSDIRSLNLAKRPDQSVVLNKISIGIEIDSWGQLLKIKDRFVAYPNDFGRGNLRDKNGNKIITYVPDDRVVRYPEKFKGYEYYEKYTDDQIESTFQLIKWYSAKYGIDVTYKDDIFGICDRALSMESGLYTHNSYRNDKRDIHPQPNLIEKLKQL